MDKYEKIVFLRKLEEVYDLIEELIDIADRIETDEDDEE